MKKISSTLRGMLLLALVVALGLIPFFCFACLTACKPMPEPTAPIETPQKTPDGSETKGGSETTPLPTAVPTEVPTEEPTPTAEPTATPVPEGWIIDPNGIIPNWVEIIVPSEDEGYCITKVDGKPVLQYWKESKLIPNAQWEVPEGMMETNLIICQQKLSQNNDIYVIGLLTEDYFGPFQLFYQDAEGRILYFECNTVKWWSSDILIATTDGKAIVYYWGDDFYKMHDFGEGAYVEISDGMFVVNRRFVPVDSIDFQNVNL